MDISNVLHALKNVFAHTQAVLNWKAKLLQSGLLPSCLDSGREQLIIFLLWVRILISISAQRKCNIFRAGNSSSSRYSLAQRLSAPRWAECHKIMWEELEDRSAAAQLDAGNEPAVSPPAHLSIRVLFFLFNTVCYCGAATALHRHVKSPTRKMWGRNQAEVHPRTVRVCIRRRHSCILFTAIWIVLWSNVSEWAGYTRPSNCIHRLLECITQIPAN